MKTRIGTALAAIAVAALTACGGGGEPASNGAEGAVAEMGRRAVSQEALVNTTSTTTTTAATAAATAAAYTVPTGRLLASNCFGCHGTDGRPNGGFDALAGESAEHIVSELRELAAKPDGGIMRVHALGYTDQQMWELGTYFASRR
jgi:cytochrome c553